MLSTIMSFSSRCPMLLGADECPEGRIVGATVHCSQFLQPGWRRQLHRSQQSSETGEKRGLKDKMWFNSFLTLTAFSCLAGLQVIHQLKQLGTVWQDVLPVSIYCEAMGNLLKTAITEIIAKIMMLEVCLVSTLASDSAFIWVLFTKDHEYWFSVWYSFNIIQHDY